MTPEEFAAHVRSLHSHDARATVRQCADLDALARVREVEKRRSIRVAAEARARRLREESNDAQWSPPDKEATVRDTIGGATHATCPLCKRTLPLGPALDEIGIRRKRNVLGDRVEYVILPQSRCHRCSREHAPQYRKNR